MSAIVSPRPRWSSSGRSTIGSMPSIHAADSKLTLVRVEGLSKSMPIRRPARRSLNASGFRLSRPVSGAKSADPQVSSSRVRKSLGGVNRGAEERTAFMGVSFATPTGVRVIATIGSMRSRSGGPADLHELVPDSGNRLVQGHDPGQVDRRGRQDEVRVDRVERRLQLPDLRRRRSPSPGRAARVPDSARAHRGSSPPRRAGDRRARAAPNRRAATTPAPKPMPPCVRVGPSSTTTTRLPWMGGPSSVSSDRAVTITAPGFSCGDRPRGPRRRRQARPSRSC